MAYQYNKPAPNDALNQSQVDLQNNFIALNTAFDVNHVGFNVADEGKHDFIHFPLQTPGASIPPATSGTEVGLYNRNSHLYFRPASSLIGVTTDDRQIDLPLVTAMSTSTTNFEGLKIIWGTATVNSSPALLTFADGGFPNACYQVIVCINSTSSSENAFVNVDNSQTTKTQFFCRSFTRGGSPSTNTINYVAFGY